MHRVIVALGERSDDGVPRKAIGSAHLAENRARVPEIAAARERAEAEDLGGGERLLHLAGLDHVGVDLLEVGHGLASRDLREEEGRVSRWCSGGGRVHCGVHEATRDERCDELAIALLFFSRAFHHTLGLTAWPIRPNKPGLKPTDST